MLFMANNTLHIVVIYIIKYISDYHLVNCQLFTSMSEESDQVPVLLH